jgi:hypothetical protein
VAQKLQTHTIMQRPSVMISRGRMVGEGQTMVASFLFPSADGLNAIVLMRHRAR